MSDETKCQQCNKADAEPAHECPFQEELNDSDDKEYCNCCEECRRECLYSI